MRLERHEFFPDHAGKGSLLSSYEAETGLLWMWAALSCFAGVQPRWIQEIRRVDSIGVERLVYLLI